MPDPNNPTDPSQNPPAPTGMGMPPTMPEPTVTAEIPPLPSSDASLPPPEAGAPIPPDSQPVDGMASQDTSAGSAAPSFDMPPVVTPGQPKKKFGGKRVIATILGLLVLVGGLGAGIVLVRQQQDIREKAAISEPCNVCIGGKCIKDASPPDCSASLNQCNNPGGTCGSTPKPQCTSDSNCKSPLVCQNGKCVNPPPECTNDSQCPKGDVCQNQKCVTPPAPPPTGGGQCSRVTQVFADHNAASITVSQAMMNECTSKCPTGKLWVARYKCDGIKLTQGCQDNGEILSQDAKVGQTFSANNPSCGTIQVDVGCKNTANTYGNVGGVSKGAAQACSTPTNPPGPGPSAQCLNVKAYDTDWNLLSTDQLKALKAGDKLRFTVAGTTTGGSFDKARFKINGVQRPEVTQKKPSSEEYYDEYTVPESIASFTINAQIHHATLGWSE